MNDFVKVSCEKIEEEFVRKVLPINFLPKGIIPSEGFAFCALSKSLSIEMILESGVCNGMSTLMWSKFFQTTPIIAVDKSLPKSTTNRFGLVSNVQLLAGKGENLLPSLIQKNSQKKIAIFIDGPKGMNAVNLAKRCLEFSNVCMVGVHDVHKISVGKPCKVRQFLDDTKAIDFYTDDLEFVEKYSFMDELKNCIGQIHWKPGWIKSGESWIQSLGNYAPTIGFMLKKRN